MIDSADGLVEPDIEPQQSKEASGAFKSITSSGAARK